MSKLKKALEKAKEERQDDTGISDQASDSAFDDDPIIRPQKQGEVRVTYTKTRVINIDPRVLKQNKVISLFHEEKMTDQLKILRAQVLNMLEQIGGNSLLVSSANPGEGKTFTAINLAISIAQELSRTVLLVDADLRPHTSQHKDFARDFLGANVSKGLADCLISGADIAELLFNPGIEKLTVLPSGRPLANSAEILGSSRMGVIADEIKARYSGDRIIIFDSPAVLTCSDPMVLSKYADGILLVVEAEKTSAEDLKRVMELLKDRPVLGTLLNKVKN
ncbi:putative exopolysaccharide/PEPCTERM locus tyrosine autokinase [uncultured Desulfobacterium sp.]|uniref:Putative exopolysaccharide/PEPCTERM locus tyrosine autokinase n=1 Tax=uncultured Desulfobacterium sp. TaxID=201089 RepID=A0A445MUW5_9BACT|nr:putative exopolysaccharide/PEPCTERM locus tyrosine autokinase [uncultured Desulfobacterium sp.]